MATYVPYVSASFDELGAIILDEFSFNLDLTFDYGTNTSTEFVNFSWDTTESGVTPVYLFDTDFNVDYVAPVELQDSSGEIRHTSFQEGGEDSSVEVYSGLSTSYSTRTNINYTDDELASLQEQYKKYGDDSDYRSFSIAYNGIVDTLTNEIYDLINKDEPVVLFKKTTQKPINLNSLAVLTSSAAPSTQTITTTSATATTTTTTTTYSGGGGGSSY
tara:strand:+ start:66 stop:716 length:651 start_codon:yes stop_codon:yes gene_type:complete